MRAIALNRWKPLLPNDQVPSREGREAGDRIRTGGIILTEIRGESLAL